MAINYKVLGQVNPAATTATTLYTVGASTEAVVSTISVCNTGTGATFRVAVRPDGATLEAKHYILYETALAAYESQFYTVGITLNANDVITVYASSANLSFNAFGSEIV